METYRILAQLWFAEYLALCGRIAMITADFCDELAYDLGAKIAPKKWRDR